MQIIKWLAVAGAALVVVVVTAVAGAARLGALSGSGPGNLGVREGRLAPPSPTANSVSSQARLHPGHPMQVGAMIAPLAAPADPGATLARIEAIVAAMPEARVVERTPGYLRVEFTSRWLRFVDDAEFWSDPAQGVVQVRSASRLGRKDFGVNRARIEAIRERLGAAA